MHPFYIPGNINRSKLRYECTIDELYLLAKLVHAEARGEKIAGKIAVASVVLNRIESELFPNTIKEVIFQPRQFTAIVDGQIHLQPHKEDLQAAYIALTGYDPTEGCLYYYNPKITTSKWIYTRKVIKIIGNHRFAI